MGEISVFSIDTTKGLEQPTTFRMPDKLGAAQVAMPDLQPANADAQW